MLYDNSLNTGKGREFQERVCQALTKHYNAEFDKDYTIAIGNPAKEHKFDLVSIKPLYIIAECKNFSWTEGGNIPDAKMAKCDQAVLYLQHAPNTAKKFLVMRKDTRPGKRETLAEYFKRTHQHLLGDISVLEFDPSSGKLTEV